MNKGISMKIALLVLIFSVFAFSAELNFEQQLSAYRLASIEMCAKLQKPSDQIDQTALLAEIDSMQSQWSKLQARFIAEPPASYAKDPKWKGYFAEVEDNAKIMRERVVSKQYGRAMQFCGMNCMLFVQMNQINGVVKLSDQLFLLRKNAKLALDMAKAGNWEGAQKTMEQSQAIEKRLADALTKKELVAETVRVDYAQMLAAYANYKTALQKKDATLAQAAQKKLMELLAIVYPRFV